MSRATNLVFYCHPNHHSFRDFTMVAERISRVRPEIRASTLSSKQKGAGLIELLRLAARPTLAIEMARPMLLHILRGKRLSHPPGYDFKHPKRLSRSISKIEEMRILEAAGLPVPRWAEITPDTKLDPTDWGPYLVVKPSYSGRGYQVWIRRTTKVRYLAPKEYEQDSPARFGPMIAQEFIYTGRQPESIRVLTFLGRPIIAVRYHSHPQPNELKSRFGFKGIGGHHIVAFDADARLSLVNDVEVLELARRAHAAFPDVPSLGVDIIQDADTGKYYVLETNPQGPNWSLSNPNTSAIAARSGIDLYRQFDALQVVSDASIDAVERFLA